MNGREILKFIAIGYLNKLLVKDVSRETSFYITQILLCIL